MPICKKCFNWPRSPNFRFPLRGQTPVTGEAVCSTAGACSPQLTCYEGWLKSFEPPIFNEEMWPRFFSCEIYNMFVYLLNSYFVGSSFWSHSSRTSQEGLQHGSSQYRWRHHPSHSFFQSYIFHVWDYLKSEGARPGEYGSCETS